MAVLKCPACDRLNLYEKLVETGFTCELCRGLIPRPPSPPAGKEAIPAFGAASPARPIAVRPATENTPTGGSGWTPASVLLFLGLLTPFALLILVLALGGKFTNPGADADRKIREAEQEQHEQSQKKADEELRRINKDYEKRIEEGSRRRQLEEQRAEQEAARRIAEDAVRKP